MVTEKVIVEVKIPDGWRLKEEKARPVEYGEFYVPLDDAAQEPILWNFDQPTKFLYAIVEKDVPEVLSIKLDWTHPAPRFVHPDSKSGYSPTHVWSIDGSFRLLRTSKGNFHRIGFEFPDGTKGDHYVRIDPPTKAVKILFMAEEAFK